MAVLIFLLILFVLVLVHEWGHFIVAKKTGMRVDEFGIGFPPKIFGIKWGETEYTFNLLPIGGFVRIYGEDARDASARLDEDFSEQSEGKNPSSGQHRYDEDAVDVPSSPAQKKVEDGASGRADLDGSFTQKSKWAQAAVLLAGVTMNVLLAFVLFSVALGVGTKSVVEESEATADASLVITETLPDSPAAAAGVPQGAEVVTLSAGEDSLSELTPSAFSAFIASHSNETLVLSYRASDDVKTVQLDPEPGVIEGNTGRPAIGVALALLETVSRSPGAAIYEGAVMTVTSVRDIAVGIASLLWDAARLKADFSQVAGPVGIVGLVGEASAFGLTSLLLFTAFISLNLAVINVLPFPALDGGRLLFVLIEAAKGSPINPKIAGSLNAVGFVLLILLMVAVTYHDILRLF